MRRCAALLQQIFEVDPLACPCCDVAMRVIALSGLSVEPAFGAVAALLTARCQTTMLSPGDVVGFELYFSRRTTMPVKRLSVPSGLHIILLWVFANTLSYYLYQRIRGPRLDTASLSALVDPKVSKQLHGGQSLVGFESSAVLMTVFSDFQCGFCARLARSVDSLSPAHSASVFVRYRHNPRSTSHPHASAAANASECAADQGRFRAYHDALFRHQSQIGITEWTAFALQAGVGDTLRFRDCVDRLAHDSIIKRDVALAKRMSLNGTPTFLIGDILVRGAVDTDSLERLIEREVARIGSK